MVSGPVIEFLEHVPTLISVGNDGLFPYEYHPLDEIYVVAKKDRSIAKHSVKFLLPNYCHLDLSNSRGSSPIVKVHEPGFLWHDRTRDLLSPSWHRWLSIYGFTIDDPRELNDDTKFILAELPGDTERENITSLLPSQQWREVKDFHTRNREWMKNVDYPKISVEVSSRYERDTGLVAKIKLARGSACQICGYKFTKRDGTDYCEVHHLEALADGGLDVCSNMLVLCANCHRIFHYGNVKVLNHTHSKITLSINGSTCSCEFK